ncbi:MAG: alpha-glucosidase [Oscillospiraceae bacterium]|nr:alpha-glucosidase [Oscillospiraceae bacterium]
MERTRWYKDMVFYQIWPRSFCDGNGDGIGDLQGVYEKLDYIQSLGADGIWFSPLYPSPGIDCGYDISDYMNIAAEYGGMEWFRKVLDGAHARGMKVIMDLVVNHTSDEHEWFQKSRRRVDPYTDYYIWRPKKANGKLPNNWDSNFEGKAWQYDPLRGEYYLHLFAVKQPDLNMDNPLVREEVKKVLRFWLELGVDGFREDVITYISKAEGLPDDHLFPVYKGMPKYNHGPHIHEYLSEFRTDVLSHYDCMTLAEAPLVWPKRALEYIRETPNSEIDMMIQFQCMCADCLFSDYFHLPFSLRRMKRAFSSWQNKLEGKAWNMLYLENHDHPRVVSRYGSEQYRAESAKSLAAAYLFLKGTPFVYQGQEIGMTSWYPEHSDMYEDVQTRNQYRNLPESRRLPKLHQASRDSARTPMQWSDEENAGFTSGKPWFYVNRNYTEINVAQQENDPESVLNFYRKAIALRKALPVVKDGIYRELHPLSNRLYMYLRQTKQQQLLVVCSFSSKAERFRMPKGFTSGELLLGSYPDEEPGVLRPYECRVYLKQGD